MWPGFANFTCDDVSSKDKLSYLNFIWHSENLGFQNQNEKNLVSLTISKWVESPLTRYEGLVLWHVSLEKANLYLSNWGRLLQASLELSASSSTRKIGLKILNQMVFKFGGNSEYEPAFQRFMPGLMPVLLLNLEDNEGFVLTCESLVVCIKYLPGILSPSTPNIEEFLVKHLDNESIEVVEALADCFAIFPICILNYLYPKGRIQEAWSDLYLKTVNTLHTIFEDILLYETGSNGPRAENHRTPIFTVPCTVERELSYLCHKVRVFSSLSRCLSKLICSKSCKVKVYVEELFELIQRVISFPEETVTQEKDNSVIHLIFPKMCHVAFMLLEAIVLNISVVEHTDNILELALKAMENAQLVSPTPGYHSKVQFSTWKFLNIWIKQCGSTVSSKIVSEKIIDDLLKDIAVTNPENFESSESVLRRQTCTEALKVLNMFVETAPTFFTEKKAEALTTAILLALRHTQLLSHPRSKAIPNPYGDDQCRLALYKLLLSCCVNEIPSKNSLMVQSVRIFKLALRDPSIEVVNVCQKASQLLTCLCNPKKPPPEYLIPPTTRRKEPDEDIIADWEAVDSQEDNWQHEQLNGEAAPANNLHAGVYQRDGVSQEAVMDNENSQGRSAELDSPPHYVELEPSNHSNHYNNARTMSRDSSISEDLPETDSDESVSEEVENDRVPNRHNRAPIDIPSARNTTRPNIQTLEACSTANEDSSDANVCAVQEVQSDNNSVEEDLTPLPSPKRVVAENGDQEEYDEEECEEDDEEEEDEDAGVFPEERLSPDEERMSPEREELLSPEPEERLSPEPEERPLKKQRLNDADFSTEMGSGEEGKEENEVHLEVNGQQGDSEKSLQKENPTVEEMMSDFVLDEAPDS